MEKCRILILAGLFLILASVAVAAENTASEDTKVKRAVFQVENLTCGACFSKINKALGSMEGFAGMGSNLFRKMVAIDFKAPLTPETIGKAISGIGYPATLDRVESLKEKETFAYMQSLRPRRAGGGCCGSSVSAPSDCAGSGPAGCAPPQPPSPSTDI